MQKRKYRVIIPFLLVVVVGYEKKRCAKAFAVVCIIRMEWLLYSLFNCNEFWYQLCVHRRSRGEGVAKRKYRIIIHFSFLLLG